MNKIKECLSGFPGWIFTVLTVLLILWLTLAPDPLGDDSPELFPGADKIVHGIMFGFLTVVALLDSQRKSGWLPASSLRITMTAVVATLFGIAIEFAQRAMEMGRGFETADMAADGTGALICALLWRFLQHYWSGAPPKD